MLFRVIQTDRKFDYYLMAFMLVITLITVGALSRVPNKLILYGVCLLMGGLLVWIYFLIRAGRSLTYVVDKEGIMIHYGFKHVLVPWHKIYRLERRQKVNLVKFAGSEWPGNYTGYFRETGSRELIAAYSASKTDVVVINTPGLKYLISPENISSFFWEASKYQLGLQTREEEEVKNGLLNTAMGKRMIILNILALIFVAALIQCIAGSNNQIPLHYNLQGEIDRYGSPYELYLMLLGPIIMMSIMYYVSSYLHRAGIKEAAAYLSIPLLFTIFMGMVIISMV